MLVFMITARPHSDDVSEAWQKLHTLGDDCGGPDAGIAYYSHFMNTIGEESRLGWVGFAVLEDHTALVRLQEHQSYRDLCAALDTIATWDTVSFRTEGALDGALSLL